MDCARSRTYAASTPILPYLTDAVFPLVSRTACNSAKVSKTIKLQRVHRRVA